MASVTYNGQSFSIDGRRFWILGASIQYARVPSTAWADRIAAARQAGFNTIDTACPWMIHEPRKGRFHFQGDADVRRFVELCAQAGMRVILRVGPFIGSEFDGGGLPGWLIEMPGIVLREANEVFLEHVSRYFRKLLSEVADLQATQGGPILLMQSEHAWDSHNDHQADRYLAEVTRFIRESAITIPISNANDLWQQSPETIDTWRGSTNLLVHLRQLRSLQPSAPRIVSEFRPAEVQTWGPTAAAKSAGRSPVRGTDPQGALNRLAEILAAGAQPVVSPFHAGTNFGFLGGRIAGQSNGFVCTNPAHDAPLGEAGDRGQKYHALRRLITFARNFSHVFADLDPDYHPIVLDPDEVVAPAQEVASDRERLKRIECSVSVVPLRGAQGRIVFIFGGKLVRDTWLLLDDGVRLPVHLGEQSVGWFVLDVDLQGSGRLDYANVCPWAIVDRSIAVFFGPEKAAAYLSISDTPLEAIVPASGTNARPLVVEHRGITVLLCNHAQIDSAYHDDSAVYVGIGGFDEAGKPIPAPGNPKAWVIRKGASIEPLSFAHPISPAHRRSAASIDLGAWDASSTGAYCSGDSPRFASLEGPETLGNCGAPLGYGWYRIAMNSSGMARALCHLPQAADRIHLYMDGKLQRVFGVAPGANPQPLELRFAKGPIVLSALVDNLGRFCEGNELGMSKGVYGHLLEIKELRGSKAKVANARPVDPFRLRGFIARRAQGQMSDTRQAIWTFNHTKKLPVIVDVIGCASSGTFVLNDHPVAYYAGATGGLLDRIMLDPRTNKHFKRGNNTLRFAPDARQEDAAEDAIKHTTLYECLEVLTENAEWAFAKWEPPSASTFAGVPRAEVRKFKGQPCWWRASFSLDLDEAELRTASLWLDCAALSKGQAFINGQNLGRYFTATADGKPVGPQTRMYVPGVWLKGSGQSNEVMVFDEHGFDPYRVKIVRA